MKVEIIKEDKNSIDVELDSVTIAEILRVYLNKGNAKIAVWRREHPTKNAVLHVEGDKPKQHLKDAIKDIEKDVDSFLDEFKKLK